MNDQARVNLSAPSPFVSPAGVSFADVLAVLATLPGLKPSRLRDMRSAISGLSRILGRPPEQLPANLDWLRRQLGRIRPAEAGLSVKGLTNLKSAVRGALVAAGITRKREDWLRPPSPAWAALLASIPVRWDRSRLSYFSRYCSALGIEPEAIGDGTVRDYVAALEAETFVTNPEKSATLAIDTWNQYRGRNAGWPQVALTRWPLKRVRWTLRFEEFPASFQAELAAWTRRLAAPDPLDEDAPTKALRPASVEYRRRQVQSMASALVRSGFPLECITGFAVLVEIENFKLGLRYLIERAGGKSTEAIHGLATGMRSIAKYQVKVPEAELAALQSICRRLDLKVDGLREKNRTRLQALDDPDRLGQLLNLPAELERLSARVPRYSGRQSRRAALLIQAALAIEILLYCPMRIGNLVRLDTRRHIRRIKDRRGVRTLLSIPGEEVKNGKELHYELGAASSELLDHYLAKARPVLLKAPSDFLFPSRDGGHRRPHVLGGLVRATIREQTGLSVNAHLFRSIAGKIHNRIQPGDFVTLSHTLGDTLETTMAAYGQFERAASIRHYQNSVDKARAELGTAVKPRRRKP